jgi:P-type E1-E2 ATPase
MIELIIPGKNRIEISQIVFDVNGTLAVDGTLISGVKPRIQELKERVGLHLLTANTHGKQDQIDRQLGLQAVQIQSGNEAEQKRSYVESLGNEQVIAIGQGANDAAMLKTARIGICVGSPEGTAVSTLQQADIFFPDIISALDSILNPIRLKASLRD